MRRQHVRQRRAKMMPPALLIPLLVLASSLLSSSTRLSERSCSPAGSAYAEESVKQKDDASAQNKPRPNKVIVYVTSWCPACKMTTDYLREKKIPHTVKDVEKNRDYMMEMVEKVGGYRGVPVLDVNGKVFLGFNPYILNELIE